jgi:nucleoside-diphosphate-sugar epimerase
MRSRRLEARDRTGRVRTPQAGDSEGVREVRAMVTGGTGFLGCHIARRFLGEGWDVRLVDVLDLDEPDLRERQGPPGGQASGPRVEVVIADVRDPEAMRRACAGVDVVLHTAAALPIQGSRQIIEAVNVGGTRNVLEGAVAAGVRRVIAISSTALYGIPDIHPLYEDSPISPLGLYGISKHQLEQQCQAYRARGLDVVVVRPKTFIGTGRLGLFQILFDWIQRGKRIPILGRGDNRYQLLAVTDLVDALWRMATLEQARNELFNVGAERFGTVREDLEALCRHAATGSRLVSIPVGLAVPVLRALEVLRLSPLVEWHYRTAYKDSFVSVDKAKRVLGWRPQKSNAEVLIETYDWYLQHYQEYLGKVGLTHRVPWDQKVLKVVRAFF